MSPNLDDLEPGRIELDRNLGTDLHQTPQRILGDHYQNPITEDTDEDGELRKMLASPLYGHGRGEIMVLLRNPQLQGNQKQK